MKHIIDKAKKIKCLITDVDGVLTNGLLYLDNQGQEVKAFHIQDGMGLKLLMAAGIDVAVITTSRNTVIDHRMQQLGITHYFKGQVDKRDAYQSLKSRLQLSDDAFAYVGDDLPDLAIIKQVGLGIAVANAVAAVKQGAAWQTELPGGAGAIREVCDFILEAQQKQDEALER